MVDVSEVGGENYGIATNPRLPPSLNTIFFSSADSVIATELKLDHRSSLLLKYAALMDLEERRTGRRSNLGLLYILPETALHMHWQRMGLDTPQNDGSLLKHVQREKFTKQFRSLLETNEASIARVLDRLHLPAISWASLRLGIVEIEEKLVEIIPGEQNATAPPSGFRAELEIQKKTGC